VLPRGQSHRRKRVCLYLPIFTSGLITQRMFWAVTAGFGMLLCVNVDWSGSVCVASNFAAHSLFLWSLTPTKMPPGSHRYTLFRETHWRLACPCGGKLLARVWTLSPNGVPNVKLLILNRPGEFALASERFIRSCWRVIFVIYEEAKIAGCTGATFSCDSIWSSLEFGCWLFAQCTLTDPWALLLLGLADIR